MRLIMSAEGLNVLRKSRLITQSSTKRITAAALAAMIARNAWTNGDAGEALGCSANTIANRLKSDDPDKQMTAHELRRSVAVEGPQMVSAIFADDGYHLVPTHCATVPDAIAAAGSAARCAADIITAAPDGFDRDEATSLLPSIERLQHELAGLAAHLRAIIAGTG